MMKSIAIGLFWSACVVLARVGWAERAVLAILRHCREGPVSRRVWMRLRAELCRQTRGTGRDRKWVTLADGSSLLINRSDLLGCLYFEREPHESATTDFIRTHLRPGDVFVDVGANFGYYSMIAASVVGPRGRVYSFEPNPFVLDCLRQSMVRNGFADRIVPVDLALADTDDEHVTFFLTQDPTNAGISSLMPWDGHLKAGNLSAQATIPVTTRRFDTWLRETKVAAIRMMKIDVEGAEARVVCGMVEALRRFRPEFIVCETGSTGPACELLTGADYTVKSLESLTPDGTWGNMLFTRQ